jgi:hypothetical protein
MMLGRSPTPSPLESAKAAWINLIDDAARATTLKRSGVAKKIQSVGYVSASHRN